MDKYERDWTIRGTVDVSGDIGLYAGNRFRVRKNGTHYRVETITGTTDWNTCTDLTLQQGNAPTFANFPDADSETLSTTGTCHKQVQSFINVSLPTNLEHLRGTVRIDGSPADVLIWVAQCQPSGRNIVILVVHHAMASAHNGTAHGDPD